MHLKTTIFLFLLVFCGSISQAQETEIDTTTRTNIKRELTVGVFPKPPYIIKGQDGNWDGISIRLWQNVAEEMNLTYRFQETSGAQDSTGIAAVDVLLLADLTQESAANMDFTHIYHISEMGAATASGMKIKSVLQAFFSKRFWYITGSLSVLLLIVGAIIYFVERSSNEDNFGGERSTLKGIGSGFWWAGVTMTTIGYGDKAPVTFWGRAIALLWMLVAMAVTSVLTASLVSAVMGSGGKEIRVPNDLRNMEVAAVADTPAENYLKEERVAFERFPSVSKALNALQKSEVELVLHDVPEMRYVINNTSAFGARVRSVHIDPHYYAMGLPTGSPLRKELNKALIDVIKTPKWKTELDRFISEKQGR